LFYRTHAPHSCVPVMYEHAMPAFHFCACEHLLLYTHFGHVHRVAVNFIRKYTGNMSSITFPQSILPPTDASVMPLDNLCLTDINSPRSKYNAKPQSCEARRTVACIAKNNVLFFCVATESPFCKQHYERTSIVSV